MQLVMCVYIYIYIYISLSLYIYIYIYIYSTLRSVLLIISTRNNSNRGSQIPYPDTHNNAANESKPIIFSGNVCMQLFKTPGSGRQFKT